MLDFLIHNTYEITANHTIIEFLVGYAFGAALIVGAPGVFFFIAFMAALQNTKGGQVGYKARNEYGRSICYEPQLTIEREPFTMKVSGKGGVFDH